MSDPLSSSAVRSDLPDPPPPGLPDVGTPKAPVQSYSRQAILGLPFRGLPRSDLYSPWSTYARPGYGPPTWSLFPPGTPASQVQALLAAPLPPPGPAPRRSVPWVPAALQPADGELCPSVQRAGSPSCKPSMVSTRASRRPPVVFSQSPKPQEEPQPCERVPAEPTPEISPELTKEPASSEAGAGGSGGSAVVSAQTPAVTPARTPPQSPAQDTARSPADESMTSSEANSTPDVSEGSASLSPRSRSGRDTAGSSGRSSRSGSPGSSSSDTSLDDTVPSLLVHIAPPDFRPACTCVPHLPAAIPEFAPGSEPVLPALQSLKSDFLSLASSKRGSRYLQALLTAYQDTAADMFLEALGQSGHLLHCLFNVYGNHVVQRLLEVRRAELSRKLYDLLSQGDLLLHLSIHRNASWVIRSLLATGDIDKRILPSLMDHFITICNSTCGNYVLQRCVENKYCPQTVIDRIMEEAPELILCKYPSHLVERVIVERVTTVEHVFRFLRRVLLTRLGPIAFDSKYACYVIQKALLRVWKAGAYTAEMEVLLSICKYYIRAGIRQYGALLGEQADDYPASQWRKSHLESEDASRSGPAGSSLADYSAGDSAPAASSSGDRVRITVALRCSRCGRVLPPRKQSRKYSKAKVAATAGQSEAGSCGSASTCAVEDAVRPGDAGDARSVSSGPDRHISAPTDLRGDANSSSDDARASTTSGGSGRSGRSGGSGDSGDSGVLSGSQGSGGSGTSGASGGSAGQRAWSGSNGSDISRSRSAVSCVPSDTSLSLAHPLVAISGQSSDQHSAATSSWYGRLAYEGYLVASCPSLGATANAVCAVPFSPGFQSSGDPSADVGAVLHTQASASAAWISSRVRRVRQSGRSRSSSLCAFCRFLSNARQTVGQEAILPIVVALQAINQNLEETIPLYSQVEPINFWPP